ncbi:DUF1648 domain-containing protein [Aequorivita sinensis]|uniref:DUF1648 domain-containing protein n=1 Tax=Aequorivita sinensis TaxID=1382458 RepID=UPI001C553D6A|nr:DUF1648 domain-containing protein [Aequorivita sinensis]
MILASAILIIYFYNQLPEKLPIYFNWPSKDIDGYGAKNLLWASPIICGIIGIGIYILNQYPWIFNYPTDLKPENAEKNYKIATRMLRIINLVIGFTCLILTYFSILAGLNKLNGLDRFLFPTLPILLFLPIIYYLVKSYRMNKKLKK